MRGKAMQRTVKSKLIFVGILLVSGAVGIGATRQTAKPRLREITFEAEKYAYTPSRLKVNVGDTLKISMVSKDVTHGFYLEGFDFNAYVRPELPGFFLEVRDSGEDEEEEEEEEEEDEGGQSTYRLVQTYTVVVDRIGKFRYRCSVTCGTMHPFMQGELIVGPNYPYTTAISLSIGLMLGALFYFSQTGRSEKKSRDESQPADKPKLKAPPPLRADGEGSSGSGSAPSEA
jgi:plastocyanin